jgi:hypothetical protein
MDGEEGTRYLKTASEIYDEVIFNTDALFNEPAPEPWVSFMIGGVSHFDCLDAICNFALPTHLNLSSFDL